MEPVLATGRFLAHRPCGPIGESDKMAFWDFMKGSGKSVLGAEAEAATPKAPTDAELAKAETDRKVAALNRLLK